MKTRLYGMYVEVIGKPQLLLLSLYRVSCSLSGVCARLASLGASRDPFKSTPSHIGNAGTADDSTSDFV